MAAVKEAFHLFTKINLRDGNKFPIFGLGTWLAEKDECKNACIHAVKNGYRLLDTASCYYNEEEVGRAIIDCGIPREEIFVTNKLWETDHGRDKATEAFHDSLRKLGLDYVDLYLIHSPTGGKVVETWDALIKLQQQKLIRSIGVSNFNIHHLEKLIKSRPHNVPVVNQIEISPFNTREDLVSYCQNHNIAIQAFSPLTKGKFLKDPQLVLMANKYGKSEAQMLIRWSLQRGYICIPKSINHRRIIENAEVFDFEISQEDMRTMNGWDRKIVTDWNVIESEWID